MGAQIRTPLPVYTTGTISANGGTPVVTGVGTAWTALDPSGNTINSIMGGDLFVTASGPIPIKSVDNASQITLECNIGATINAGSAYRIIKYSANQTGGVTTALGNVLVQGTDTTPDLSRTIDSGAGRAKLRIGPAGDAQMAVGLTGAIDLALTTAIDISLAGLVTFPAGVSIPAIYGRNRLRNPNFATNQRNVSGTVTLAAGAYGHDGVKGGAAGATYTFATSGIDTVLTVTTGSIILPIETLMIEGGTYTVSQAGSALARVWQGSGSTGSGSYASTPFQATGLAVGVQTNVEFSTGSVMRPQFEAGAVATAFERRPPSFELALCQRYYQQFGGSYKPIGVGTAFNSSFVTGFLSFSKMRAVPTVSATGSTWVFVANQTNTTITSPPAITTVSDGSARLDFTSGVSTVVGTAGIIMSADSSTIINVSAEL